LVRQDFSGFSTQAFTTREALERVWGLTTEDTESTEEKRHCHAGFRYANGTGPKSKTLPSELEEVLFLACSFRQAGILRGKLDCRRRGRILRSQLFQQAGSFAHRMKQSSIQWSASWLAAKEGDLICQPEHRAHPDAILIILFILSKFRIRDCEMGISLCGFVPL